MNIKEQVKKVLKSGNWVLRRSNKGKSYEDFQWKPIGKWTEAPDWDPEPECGGGLHGNGPESKGYWTNGKDLDFCEIDPTNMVDLGDKIKVKRARILLRNELPKDLKVGGYLDLRNTQIKELPKGLEVGGSLDLEGTPIKELPKDLKVGGYLNLRGTQITELPEGLKVGGAIYKDF